MPISPKPPPLQHGLRFEHEFFGVSSADLHQKDFPKVTRLSWNSLNVYCNDSFQRRAYGLDPSNPSSVFAHRLFLRIWEKLPENISGGPEIHCLLGTEADRLGADGVIRLRGRSNHVQVLFDLTTNPTKSDTKDVLMVRKNIFTGGNENLRTALLDEVVAKIVKILVPTSTPF